MTVLYGSSVADTTLTTACKMATTSGGVETSATTGAFSGGFSIGEFVSQTTGSATDVASIPATPTGKGWVYSPGAGTFALGNWSASLAISEAGGLTYALDVTLRFFKYSGGSYSSIGTIAVTGGSITASRQVLTFAATSMASVTFASSDRLYVDLWGNHGAGNIDTGNFRVYESTSATAGVTSDMQVTTSTFTPSGTVTAKDVSSRLCLQENLHYVPRTFAAYSVSDALTYQPRSFGSAVLYAWGVISDGASRLILGASNTQNTSTRLRLAESLEYAPRSFGGDYPTNTFFYQPRSFGSAVLSGWGNFLDVSMRLRLLPGHQSNLASRLLLLAVGIVDQSLRLLLFAVRLRDAANRLRLRAASAKDNANRLRLRAASAKDGASRLHLGGGVGYRNTVIDDNPRAYYRLNTASGTIVPDESGNGYTATLSGATTLSRPGAVASDTDTATLFRTGSSSLVLPPTLNPSAWSALSLEYWIKISGAWQHVVLTTDDTVTTLYLNGAVYTPTGGDPVVMDILAYAGSYLPGSLDEVALYAYTLTPEQVRTHFTLGIQDSQEYAPRSLGGNYLTSTLFSLPRSFGSALAFGWGNLAHVATRLVLISGTIVLRNLAARLLLRATRQTDQATRSRLLATALKDQATRVRLRVTHLQDLATRLMLRAVQQGNLATRTRLLAVGLHDASLRLRLTIPPKLDQSARLRLLVIKTVNDLGTRMLLLAVRLRDLSSRLRLSALAKKDQAARLLLQTVGLVTKDLASRLLLRASRLSDQASRLRLQVVGRTLDQTARTRLLAQSLSNAALRLRLLVSTLKDSTTRLRLLASRLRDLSARLRLAIPPRLDGAVRLRLLAITAASSLVTRLLLLAVRLRDQALRVRLRATGSRDLAARLLLQVIGQVAKDQAARLRLLAQQFQSAASRLRLLAQRLPNTLTRIRLSATTSKDGTARVRLLAQHLLDTALRLRLLVLAKRDLTARLSLIPSSATLLRDVGYRLSLYDGSSTLFLASRDGALVASTRSSLSSVFSRDGASRIPSR